LRTPAGSLRRPASVRGLIFVFALFGARAFALVIPNPDITAFGDDLEDSGIFSPTSLVIAIEFLDILGDLGVASEFGFYIAGSDLSDPGSLIPIFDGLDQAPDPGGLGGDIPDGLPSVAIFFDSGVVIDLDDGSLQATFTGAGGGPNPDIGFYLAVSDGTTVFSEPAANGDIDLAATFPFLAASDQYLLGFLVPGVAAPVTLLDIVGGITPVVVPVPPSVFLMSVAMGVLLMTAGKGQRRRFGFERRRCDVVGWGR
jgi:hypothetical protein